MAVGVVLVLGIVAWRVWLASYPIKLSPSPPPAEKGWQIQSDPFWVKAEAVGALPRESQWNGQYVIMVFRDGEPHYQRTIDPQQIEGGSPFDLAVEKGGIEYEAAFIEVSGGKPGRRISNTLSFTHSITVRDQAPVVGAMPLALQGHAVVLGSKVHALAKQGHGTRSRSASSRTLI